MSSDGLRRSLASVAALAAVSAVGGSAEVRISDQFSSGVMYVDANGRRSRTNKLSPAQRVLANQQKKNARKS